MAYYQVIGSPNRPVKAVATSAITVSGPASAVVDGYTLSAGPPGDPVLLTQQSPASQNGVWIFNGTGVPMTRPTGSQDQYKSGNVLDNNTLIPVTNGNAYAGTIWGIDPAQKVTVDTDPHAITLAAHPPVQARVATVGNISLINPVTTIDGVTLRGNGGPGSDIILVKDNGHPGSQNGLYWANPTGSIARTTHPLLPTLNVHVSEGTINAHTRWAIVTQGPIVPGTTAIDFGLQNPGVNVRDFGAIGDGSNDDTSAIAAAILAASGTNDQTVFPPGVYKVSTLTITVARVEWVAIGHVTVTSDNTLGNGMGTTANQAILISSSCTDAIFTGFHFVGNSDPNAGNMRYAAGPSTPAAVLLPVSFNPSGSASTTHNRRDGIVFNGTGSLVMTACEVTNFPARGVSVTSGTGRHKFTDCNFHGNGLANLWAYPGHRIYTNPINGLPIGGPYGMVDIPGSVEITGGSFNDALPVAWTSPCYGIDVGGCDFSIVNSQVKNNTAFGINNDDANDSSMRFIGTRFEFGPNNGLLFFDQVFASGVSATAGSAVVSIQPFPAAGIFEGLAIQIPGVFWHQTNVGVYPDIVSRGTNPPTITITGTANQGVVFLMQTTTPGGLGTWKFQYSTDNGVTWHTNVTSAATVAINNSSTNTATGLTLNIATGQSSLDNVWKFDNTWANSLSYNVSLHQATVGIVDASGTSHNKVADTSSGGGNTSITWVLQTGGLLLNDNGPCSSFIAQGNSFVGSAATLHQLGAMLIKGHEFDNGTSAYNRPIPLESQRLVDISGNQFDGFSDVDAVIQSLAWTAKSFHLCDNQFNNCGLQTFVHDPNVDPFDTTPTFDKKAIVKEMVLRGNTYVDCGRVVISSTGYVEILDERVIFTGKSPLPATQFFNVATTLGRIGRVIRRNCRISGAPQSMLFTPDPTVAPVAWSWHLGDREDLSDPSVDYGYTGINMMTTAGSRVITLGGIPGGAVTRASNQLLAGLMIGVNGVTWGFAETGIHWPNVFVVAVDPSQTTPGGAGNPVAVAALSADQTTSSSAGSYIVKDANGNYLPIRFSGRVCVVEGTIGTCTAHATTRIGDYAIDITDDVATLCPQQLIKIVGVTFNGADHTEVLDVTGHEGHSGQVIVRDAPDQVVTAAVVSFQAPTLVLCDRLATTDAPGG